MAQVLTTIVVNFEGSEEAQASYECWYEGDDTLNPDSLIPGQYFYFLVKLAGPVYLDKILATNGDIRMVNASGVERSRKETVLFTEYNSEGNRPSLSIPPLSITSVYWFGNVGGTPMLKEGNTLDISSGEIPCLAEITYKVKWNYLCRLDPGPMVFRSDIGDGTEETSYTIQIVIYLKELL